MTITTRTTDRGHVPFETWRIYVIKTEVNCEGRRERDILSERQAEKEQWNLTQIASLLLIGRLFGKVFNSRNEQESECHMWSSILD